MQPASTQDLLPVFDLATFLQLADGQEPSADLEQCRQLAECLAKTGCLVVSLFFPRAPRAGFMRYGHKSLPVFCLLRWGESGGLRARACSLWCSQHTSPAASLLAVTCSGDGPDFRLKQHACTATAAAAAAMHRSVTRVYQQQTMMGSWTSWRATLGAAMSRRRQMHAQT